MNKSLDTFERTEFVTRVLEIVNAAKKQEKGVAFSVSGSWGYGKTFVLNMLENSLKVSEELLVFHYDCWEYNYYDEPLMAMIASITDQLKEINANSNKFSDTLVKVTKFVVMDGITHVGGALSKQTLGVDVVKMCKDLYKDIQKDLEDIVLPDYDTTSNLRKSIAIICAIFNKISKEKRLVLIVDEIDRCVPSYQIKVLERIHHITRDQNFITVYGLNPEQLQQTVIQMYGGDGENDAKRVTSFLRKYMDFHLALPLGTLSQNCFEKYERNFEPFEDVDMHSDKMGLSAILSQIFFGCDARTIEKLWEKQFLIHNLVFTLDAFPQSERKLPLDILSTELLILVMIYWRCTKPPQIGLRYTDHSIDITAEKLIGLFFYETSDYNVASNNIKDERFLDGLWEEIAENLNINNPRFRHNEDLCIIELPEKRPQLLQAMGCFWCNATNNRYLKYEMGDRYYRGITGDFYATNFNNYCEMMRQFYEMACIIE